MKMNDEYAKYFSEKSLWEKIKKFSKAAGSKVVYAVLLLYYAMGDKNVSIKTKISCGNGHLQVIISNN